jgi:hypothetical protein
MICSEAIGPSQLSDREQRDAIGHQVRDMTEGNAIVAACHLGVFGVCNSHLPAARPRETSCVAAGAPQQTATRGDLVIDGPSPAADPRVERDQLDTGGSLMVAGDRFVSATSRAALTLAEALQFGSAGPPSER